MSWIFGKTGRLKSQRAPYKSLCYTGDYLKRKSKRAKTNKAWIGLRWPFALLGALGKAMMSMISI